MKSEPPTIKTPFHPPIKSVSDVAALLKYNASFVDSLVEQAPLLYSFFRQPKKAGGFREIRPPKINLRIFQRLLYQALDER